LIEAFMMTPANTDFDTDTTTTNDTDPVMRRFCFYIDRLVIHPTSTCEDVPPGLLFVSDELFDQHFTATHQNTQTRLHFMYALPKVKEIRLKRLGGNFPRDDSLEGLLTHYFESCMVVNHGQEFVVNYGGEEEDQIRFRVTRITYVEEPRKRIGDRFDEMNVMVRLNELLAPKGTKVGIHDCGTSVHHFCWYFHTIASKEARCGDVSFQNVEIDFEESDLPPPLPPLPQLPPPLPSREAFLAPLRADGKPAQSQSQPPPPPLPSPERLSAQELRERRLRFFT
jgi:hypothetical protein